jgi:hypothetical protein
MTDTITVGITCLTDDTKMNAIDRVVDRAVLMNSLAHSLNIAVETVMASKVIDVDRVMINIEVNCEDSVTYTFGPKEYITGLTAEVVE